MSETAVSASLKVESLNDIVVELDDAIPPDEIKVENPIQRA